MGEYAGDITALTYIASVIVASWLYLTDRNWHFWAFVALIWGNAALAYQM